MEPKTGTIFLQRGNGFYGKLITFFTKSEYTHNGIIISTEDTDYYLAIEAHFWKGVVINKIWKDWLHNNAAFADVLGDMIKPKRDRFRSTILKYLGNKYDKLNVIRIGILKKLGINRIKDTESSNFCSELTERVHRDMGYTIVDKKPDKITPGDHYSALKEQGKIYYVNKPIQED